MVKIDVISGFLGAGKTTIIKQLFLSQEIKNEKVVIIENEFGEIGIDGAFLKDSGVKIKEINAGCICCSLVGDFSKSIKELNDTYHPDRIIIEPSGVGKLSDIINAINNVDIPHKINILCTVVDTKKAKIYLNNFGEFFLDQIEHASHIVLAKVDLCEEEKVVEVFNIIKEHNEKATIISTKVTDLEPNNFLKTLESENALVQELAKEIKHLHHEECDDPECCCHHHHDDEECDDPECCCHHHEHEDEEEHHHHEHGHHEHCHHDHEHHHEHCHHHDHDADEVFLSFGKETPKSYSRKELENILSLLADPNSGLGTILRSKGILKASDNDKWYYFDLVMGDYEIRLGEPEYTGRFVVIGSKMDKDKIAELIK